MIGPGEQRADQLGSPQLSVAHRAKRRAARVLRRIGEIARRGPCDVDTPMAASFDYRARRESRDTSAMDETKIIAAILCAQTIVLEDVARDPIGKTVDFYERILAELRARGHGGPASDAPPRQRPA